MKRMRDVLKKSRNQRLEWNWQMLLLFVHQATTGYSTASGSQVPLQRKPSLNPFESPWLNKLQYRCTCPCRIHQSTQDFRNLHRSRLQLFMAYRTFHLPEVIQTPRIIIAVTKSTASLNMCCIVNIIPQGSLNYQPKQCTIKGKSHEIHLT